MLKWLRNKIARRLNVRDLTQADALKVYTILTEHGDESVKDKLQKALKTNAESAMGMYGMTCAWYGTELNQEVRDEIARSFTVADLYNRNLLSFDGQHIELNVLCSALPQEELMKHFHFNLEERAARKGVSLDDVRKLLHQHVKEIKPTGRWGDRPEVHFHKTLDVNGDEVFVLIDILGAGGIGDQGDGTYVVDGPLAVQNIKKLMHEDKVFMDKFEFLKGLS
jgi:hypothetical protein